MIKFVEYELTIKIIKFSNKIKNQNKLNKDKTSV